MRRTPFAGLTALDQGESVNVDGGSFLSRNPVIIDQFLLVGARTHRHDNHPALPDPQQPPLVDVATTGGALPADSTIVVCYALIDDAGGETLPSPVTAVTTDDTLPEPEAIPITEIDYTAGTLTVGSYSYVVTLLDGAGGETTPSGVSTVVRDPGPATARVVITDLDDFIAIAPGAVRYRLYRAQAGGTFNLLHEGVEATVIDDGAGECDCCTHPPAQNTTGGAAKITVQIASTAVQDAAGWKLYVAVDGDFTSPSQYGPVRTPASVAAPIVIGQLDVVAGAPLDVATTVAGAGKIDPDTDLLGWHWKRPVATVADLPVTSDTVEGDVRVVTSEGIIYVFSGGSWAPITAVAQNWMPPVADAAALPMTGNSDGDVRMTLNDFALHGWQAGGWWDVSGGGGGGTGGHTIQDEGVARPARAAINFTGAGVTASDDAAGNRTIVNIPGGGGGGGGGHTIERLNPDTEAWESLPDRSRLRIFGDAVTIDDNIGEDATEVQLGNGIRVESFFSWQDRDGMAAFLGVEEYETVVADIAEPFSGVESPSAWDPAFEEAAGRLRPLVGTFLTGAVYTPSAPSAPVASSINVRARFAITTLAQVNDLGIVVGGDDAIALVMHRATDTFRILARTGAGAWAQIYEGGVGVGWAYATDGGRLDFELTLRKSDFNSAHMAISNPDNPGGSWSFDTVLAVLDITGWPPSGPTPGCGAYFNLADPGAAALENFESDAVRTDRRVIAGARAFDDGAMATTVLVDSGAP